MTLQITLINEDVHIIRDVDDWYIEDKLLVIYAHNSYRDLNNDIYSDWMHIYKIHKDNVKDIHEIEVESEDKDV